MAKPPAGWYVQPRDPSTEHWWDGERWTPTTRPKEERPLEKSGPWQIRYIERQPNGVEQSTLFPNRFPSQQQAEQAVISVITQTWGGVMPVGSSFEFVRDGEPYGKFIAKRMAKIGAVGVAAAIFGFLVGG